MKRTLQATVRAPALALGLAGALACAPLHATTSSDGGALLLAQGTGSTGSSGAAPPPPTPPPGTSPRGSGSSVFDKPEERQHSGEGAGGAGSSHIDGSARVPNAINRNRAPSNPATRPFESVDRNGDGALDRDEARAVRGLNFERLDTNQNGLIERREYEADAQARKK